MTAGTPLNTLLLDQTAWDLLLDATGNLALAQPPYALAQDAASYVRCFRGEPWYNTALGVPYFPGILGANPPLSLIKSSFSAAALQVPGILAAQPFVTSLANRVATGQIQVTDAAGVTLGMTF